MVNGATLSCWITGLAASQFQPGRTSTLNPTPPSAAGMSAGIHMSPANCRLSGVKRRLRWLAATKDAFDRRARARSASGDVAATPDEKREWKRSESDPFTEVVDMHVKALQGWRFKARAGSGVLEPASINSAWL